MKLSKKDFDFWQGVNIPIPFIWPRWWVIRVDVM